MNCNSIDMFCITKHHFFANYWLTFSFTKYHVTTSSFSRRKAPYGSFLTPITNNIKFKQHSDAILTLVKPEGDKFLIITFNNSFKFKNHTFNILLESILKCLSVFVLQLKQRL